MRLRYLVFLLLAFSCVRENKTNAFQSLPVNEFETSLAKTSEKIIIDVRTAEEYNEGHLANAVLINFLDDDFAARISTLDKETPIYIYCASGVRSEKAASLLLEHGFTDIIQLKGGIKDWADANKKIVRK